MRSCYAVEELLCREPINDPPDQSKHPKKRRKRIILARRDAHGELEAIPPRESMWYHMYVDCPRDEGGTRDEPPRRNGRALGAVLGTRSARSDKMGDPATSPSTAAPARGRAGA